MHHPNRRESLLCGITIEFNLSNDRLAHNFFNGKTDKLDIMNSNKDVD
jgi:hypothetical protein